MFAVTYDDWKRKLQFNKDQPYIPVKIDTCIKGTPSFEVLYTQFMSDNNKDIHVTIEPDGSTYTFYKMVKKEELEATK